VTTAASPEDGQFGRYDAALPDITDDMMRSLLCTVRPYTVVVLTKTDRYDPETARPIIWEHGRRNMALRAAGRLVVVCPVSDGTPLSGIGIFAGTPEEVAATMEADPGVLAGIFAYAVHPSRSFPGDALP
jgi:hypothetical protein